MEFRYGLEDLPPLGETLLMGFQWCALMLPFLVILGKIAAAYHLADPAYQTAYLQKMAFVIAIFLVLEILWGHRLPLIMGPSSVILIGIISSHGFDLHAISTAIISGGVILAFAGITGVFGHIQRLFTPRVVAVVLLLIAFTLTPAILKLVSEPQGATPQINMVYALALTAVTLILHRLLTGIWKSVLIMLSMLVGTAVYFFIFPENFNIKVVASSKFITPFFTDMIGHLSFDPGLLISFFVCFLALSINDLGSMQSMNALVNTGDMAKRINRGIFLTGLANVTAGVLGVIGQVNYSMSVGIVAATGCMSRYTLLPAAAFLLLISFSPMAIGFLGIVPPAVIGSIMFYVLCSQVSAGLLVAFESLRQLTFDDGMIIGMPILIATVIAFLPAAFVQEFPRLLRPIAGNGFVVGVIIVLLMEHGIFRKSGSQGNIR
ncbi:MAG TPA: solute carrier family 23 protein [Syntrophales bacterium]|nr:solute carrier family 23 protein [Syntrophales bacterium]